MYTRLHTHRPVEWPQVQRGHGNIVLKRNRASESAAQEGQRGSKSESRRVTVGDPAAGCRQHSYNNTTRSREPTHRVQYTPLPMPVRFSSLRSFSSNLVTWRSEPFLYPTPGVFYAGSTTSYMRFRRPFRSMLQKGIAFASSDYVGPQSLTRPIVETVYASSFHKS